MDPLREDDRPDAGFELRWRQQVKRRALVLLAVVACWVGALEARLVQLQVFRHDEYAARAKAQQESPIIIDAPRGDLFDRHGRLLAYSIETEGLMADPRAVDDPAAAVAALCAALGDCKPAERATLLKRLSVSDGSVKYVSIRKGRDVTAEQIERVRAADIPGIGFEMDATRYYPGSETAAHVIGFLGADGVGRAGIEYRYDEVLRGEPGYATAQVDGRQQRLQSHVVRDPVPGASLHLTIDAELQRVVERELARGVREHRALAGTAIVMDPHTGEVLALANYPTYNPNSFGKYSNEARNNRAVTSAYEPGSTFKIVTISAALEERLIHPDELIDTNPGYLSIPGRRKLITDTHNYGVLTFRDVIAYSSNIGAVRAGLRLGAERIARYVDRFGFGQTLAPDVTGESRGIWSPNLSESALASVSMGYQVAVTPLQMVTAVSAVANGGQLLQPRFVRAVEREGRVETVEPTVLRRAIAPETARTLTAIMESVVEYGTAKTLKIPGYRIAAKTGTSHKAIPGGYSSTDYNASFVGFLPADDPRFTILVMIDTPRAGFHYGASVAGPVFRAIAQQALVLAGVPPSIDPEPRLFVRVNQPLMPPARPEAAPVVAALASSSGSVLMPDLRGLSGREALRVLGDLGMSVRSMRGVGFVVRQQPEPGSQVEPGASSTLELRATRAGAETGAAP